MHFILFHISLLNSLLKKCHPQTRARDWDMKIKGRKLTPTFRVTFMFVVTLLLVLTLKVDSNNSNSTSTVKTHMSKSESVALSVLKGTNSGSWAYEGAEGKRAWARV